VPNIPSQHIAEAHKLTADAEIDLFQLVPNDGSGTIYFKADNDITWRGDDYTGLPLSFTGLKRSSDGGSSQPRLVVGQENTDLSFFKPLVHDGYLDGAIITHYRVLLSNIIANLAISERTFYRVRRPENYNSSIITLSLSTASDNTAFTLPLSQYYPPAFPAVMIG